LDFSFFSFFPPVEENKEKKFLLKVKGSPSIFPLLESSFESPSPTLLLFSPSSEEWREVQSILFFRGRICRNPPVFSFLSFPLPRPSVSFFSSPLEWREENCALSFRPVEEIGYPFFPPSLEPRFRYFFFFFRG